MSNDWLRVIFEFIPNTLDKIFAVGGILLILLGLIYNRVEDFTSSLLNPNKISLGNGGDSFIFIGFVLIALAFIIYFYESSKN